jgi:gas vesicle structural protein
MSRSHPRRGSAPSQSELVIGTDDASLLDIVDNVLNKGVVLSGDLTIALAQVDLIYARVSLLLCAADRVLPNEDADLVVRHRSRHTVRSGRPR